MKNRIKIEGIGFVLISSLIQLLSIPLFYGIGYRIGLIFHEPYVRIGGDGMDFYYFSLYFLAFFIIICVPIITIFREFLFNEVITTIVHILWLSFIVWFSFGDLKRRPYEYGLLLICIGSTLITRLLIRKLLHK